MTRQWRLLWQLLLSLLVLCAVYLNLAMVHKMSLESNLVPSTPERGSRTEKPDNHSHSATSNAISTPVQINKDYIQKGRKAYQRVVGYDESSLPNYSDSTPTWKRKHVTSTSTLPPWMRDYFDWHLIMRKRLDNGGKVPILVIRCLKDDRCGGTADRLEPLAVYIAVASKLQRLLLIYWERPCLLEEFLVPPVGGLNWRLPPEIFSRYDLANTTHRLPNRELGLLSKTAKSSQTEARYVKLPDVATMLFQTSGGGLLWYDKLYPAFAQEYPYQQVYREAWQSFFEPSPPLQEALQQAKRNLNLSNSYVAVHIRALYQKELGPKQMHFTATNAVTCASRLRTSAQEDLYITSDSANSSQIAVDFVHSEHPQVRAVNSGRHSSGVLHLDRGSKFLGRKAAQWTTHSPSEHYATFVDLYLLAGARCVAYHIGNFGKWANLLSNSPACETNHAKHACRWKEIST